MANGHKGRDVTIAKIKNGAIDLITIKKLKERSTILSNP